MSIFNDLKASLEEAVEIKNKNKKASRVTLYAVENVKEIRKNATAGGFSYGDYLRCGAYR